MSSKWAQNSTLRASNILSCQNYTPRLKKNDGIEFSWLGTGTQRDSELSCSENFPFRRGFFLALQPPVGQCLLIHEVSRSHTTTHHSW